MLGDGSLDLLFPEQCENLDVAVSILVGHIEPELVELVRGCPLRVEPDIALLGLAELLAVGLPDERAGEGVSVCLSESSADELGSGGDVSPLVASAHLQTASLVLVEPEEVVALEELVAELGERHSFPGFIGKAHLYRVLGHHIVDRDVLSDVADEVQESVVLHPVVVVHELGPVRCIGLEIKELGKLLLDAFHIVVEGGLIEEIALLGFSGRVSDHSGSSAHEGNRLVSAFLEMLEYHNADHMAYVKRIGRGINAHVCCRRTFHKLLLSARHDVLDHAPPSEFLDKILVHICFFLFQNRWPGGRCHPRTANIDIFFRNITGEQ